MNTRIVSEVDFLPVSIEEVKKLLRVTPYNLDEDDLLTINIRASVRNLELIGWQSIIQKTIELEQQELFELNKLPSSPLEVSDTRGILEITSIQYRLNKDSEYQTLDASQYELGLNYYTPFVYIKGNVPSITPHPNAVKITYNSGYPSPERVPNSLKLAIMYLAAHFYDNRDLVAPVQLHKLPTALQYMIEPVLLNTLA